jgi:hypothetical protein
MQVNCPNCGEKVPAEHINIQNMTAVCPNCDNVFSFEKPDDKAKRRKVKQPERLTLRDAETLHMEFWTNFRLDRSGEFIISTLGGIGSTLMALLILSKGTAPVILPLIFLGFAVMCFYGLALTVINKTHIDMDDSAIRVTRRPIPNFLNRGNDVSLSGVTAIKYEETEASKKEGYDTPRYRVWAETADGTRRTIVNEVTEEYAVFLAQRMEERRHMDADVDAERDVSRLEDSYRAANEVDTPESVEASRNHQRR